MNSILQKDDDRCYLCGMPENGDHLDCHHVFEGSRRKRSEEYGLKVRLHHCRCHLYGNNAVHNNENVNKQLKRKAQAFAMGYYGWSLDDWIGIFGKSYLDDEVEVETNIFDKIEEHHNCFVQILTNSRTGEVSIGWREEYE